jgi:hypothetical protein
MAFRGRREKPFQVVLAFFVMSIVYQILGAVAKKSGRRRGRMDSTCDL